MQLELIGISKRFAGAQALTDVNFDLCRGEVHCLVGENGAGKSTLIKILAGAETPDAGRIVLDDATHAALNPRQAMVAGIAAIYQDADLVNSLTVADNIYLGMEIVGRSGLVRRREQEARATELIEQVGIDIDPRSRVEALSPARQQCVQLIKAIHREARILIMDEPTASLGGEETAVLMRLIRTLVEAGLSIIYISHHLQEVFEIGDRISVIKDGQNVSTCARTDARVKDVVKDMVGREAALFYRRERVHQGDVILQVRNYTRRGTVDDVSFDVRAGEIFGIGGLVGAGRTELMRLLFGADAADRGSLLLDGKPITPGSPREAIKNGLCLVVEDRQQDGLLPDRSVRENIAMVRNELSGLWLRNEVSVVERMVKSLHISLAGIGQPVASLSGGNQQKSILARWLLSPARVFILDEPTKGVDIGAREEIYALMVSLVREGKSIIMVSSDLPELLSMSDRIGVMHQGRLTHIVSAEAASEQQLMSLFLDLPEAA